MTTLFTHAPLTPEQVEELMSIDTSAFRAQIMCEPPVPRLSDGLWRRVFLLSASDAPLDPGRMMRGTLPSTFMGWPITPEGALAIGTHRLFLDDAYTLRPKLGWMDADCCDPQYEFDNSGGGKWRKDRGTSNEMVEEGLCEGFDHTIINPLLCGAVVVFCHDDQVGKLRTYLDGSFHRCVQLNWHKIAPAPHRNKNYIADTETYFHAWNRGYHPIGDHPDMNRYIIAARMPNAKKRFGHTTVKPDAVMNKIMVNVQGQTVCDPFMGTGSTGVAAIRAGKTFTGIEHNPKHFETAVRRIGAAYMEGK